MSTGVAVLANPPFDRDYSINSKVTLLVTKHTVGTKVISVERDLIDLADRNNTHGIHLFDHNGAAVFGRFGDRFPNLFHLILLL